jgi:hypothetical protein
VGSPTAGLSTRLCTTERASRSNKGALQVEQDELNLYEMYKDEWDELGIDESDCELAIEMMQSAEPIMAGTADYKNAHVVMGAVAANNMITILSDYLDINSETFDGAGLVDEFTLLIAGTFNEGYRRGYNGGYFDALAKYAREEVEE